MKTKKQLLDATLSAVLFAGVAAVPGAAQADNHEGHAAMEKCYGVVKAGENGCGSKKNGHSCAGEAKMDGDTHEWIKLPKGTCEKLVGGSLEPGKGGAKAKRMKGEKKKMR